jgi:hypothetical protein
MEKPTWNVLVEDDTSRYLEGLTPGERMTGMQGTDGFKKPTLYCSFCGKSQNEVKKLIAGPTVFICDECVEMCAKILHA